MYRLYFLLIALTRLAAFGQLPIVVQPIAGEVDFAGTFGELRSHHFHSGVDFRTGGQIGVPIRAVQSGYLSRMVVRPDGFGWALYIRHPEGYTSVYAHLNDFKPAWHELVIQRAEHLKSMRLDISFRADEFPVSVGEIIGWSGNSGSSGGPHLHFEWRDTKTEEPLNPFSYGLLYGSDSFSPQIIALHTSNGQEARVKNGLWEEVLIAESWQDIGVEIVDRKHAKGLNLGIQSLAVTWALKDWNASREFEMDRFSFTNSRCADGLIQPQVYRSKKIRTYRIAPALCSEPKWSTPLHSLTDPGTYLVTIEAKAANGESVIAQGRIELLASNSSLWTSNAKGKIDVQSGELIAEELRLSWDRNSFSDPLVPTLKKLSNLEWEASPDVPALRTLDYTWTPPIGYPKHLESKTVLIGRDARGTSRIVGKPLPNGDIRFQVKIFGHVRIAIDTVSPVFGDLMNDTFQGRPAKSITIMDNMLDIVEVYASINNHWTWSFFDAKNSLLYIPFSAKDHGILSITTKDEAGNQSNFEASLE